MQARAPSLVRQRHVSSTGEDDRACIKLLSSTGFAELHPAGQVRKRAVILSEVAA
jgi:hypothetical protein